MCTITCFRDTDRLVLTMNRDEFRSRAPEHPPRRFDTGPGGYWVGPADGQSGGAWIGLHSSGWLACLMNRYPAPPENGEWVSRGEIIPRLMTEGGPHTGPSRLSRLPLDDYRPFTLLLASLDTASWTAWDGRKLAEFTQLGRGWSLLTSSSWRQDDVQRWRFERFQRWLERGAEFQDDLPSFHLLQPEGEAPWAPLMAREHTHTRSITQVRFDRRPDSPDAIMSYWPSPRSVEPGTPQRFVAGSREHASTRNRNG